MCDALVALGPATETGATLFAKNSDRMPGEAQTPEWYPPRRNPDPVRATYVSVDPWTGETLGVLGSRPWWCWGLEHGVNTAGVAIGNETIFTTLDPRGVLPALIGMDLVRLGLERAATASEAVEVMIDLLERHGQGGSGHHGVDRPYWSSFLVADSSAAWVLETSGSQWATEAVDRVRAISNRTTIASFDAEHRHPRQPVADLVDPRWRASNAVLAAEPVTAGAVARHLRSHIGGRGYTVCMHVPGVEATTASMIAELSTGVSPLVARFLMGSPCRSVYVPLVVGRPAGRPVRWERLASLDVEHRPVLDALEDSLAADVSDVAGWADEAWARVDAVLCAVGR
jgi:secernin